MKWTVRRPCHARRQANRRQDFENSLEHTRPPWLPSGAPRWPSCLPAPAQSASSVHSVVPSFDCPVFSHHAAPCPRTLRAVDNLNPAPPLVYNRKTLFQIEHRQSAGPASAPAPLRLPLVLARIVPPSASCRTLRERLRFNFRQFGRAFRRSGPPETPNRTR